MSRARFLVHDVYDEATALFAVAWDTTATEAERARAGQRLDELTKACRLSTFEGARRAYSLVCALLDSIDREGG